MHLLSLKRISRSLFPVKSRPSPTVFTGREPSWSSPLEWRAVCQRISWPRIKASCSLVGLSFFLGASIADALPLSSNPHVDPAVYVHPETVGQPWPNAKNKGLLAFRGNPTRSYYGEGPLPDNPKILWRKGRYCGRSSVGKSSKVWCGTGWTGQPVVWEREDSTEVIFGAYDYNIHFLDSKTGEDVRPVFKTRDIIKGSVSLDPDGFPLLYSGSRDNFMRVISLDGKKPKELWAINGNMPGRVWNNDWDGNPLILGDYLLTGGENSWFFIAKLNRKMVDGKVTVKPKIVSKIKGFTRDLFRKIGDKMVSIENSVAVFENIVYFSNGGGLVQGYDIDKLIAGAKREEALTFEYWVGDDVDATIVIDQQGMLYVAIEKERRVNKAQKLSGQLVKLDTSKPENPIVWSNEFLNPAGGKGGLWATPALYEDFLYVATHPGELVAVSRLTGRITYREKIGWHAWSSPVVVDDQLLVGTCTGKLNRYSLRNPAKPKKIWSFKIPSGGCVESTPAVWKGNIYVGNRDGYFYAIGEDERTNQF
jgi:WD40 repeat protein